MDLSAVLLPPQGSFYLDIVASLAGSSGNSNKDTCQVLMTETKSDKSARVVHSYNMFGVLVDSHYQCRVKGTSGVCYSDGAATIADVDTSVHSPSAISFLLVSQT